MEMKRFEELAADKEFMAQLGAMESVEEITAAINARGVEISVEEMKEALELALKQEGTAELSENDLEAVSGGISIGAIIVGGLLIWTGVSIACGALAAIAERCGR